MSVVNVKNFVYNTNDLIGKGATGSVYKGVDSFSGKVVAIKAIKMSSINNDVTRYLLENQLKALQVVDHPNVVKNYDVVRNKDFTYIVMEHCPSNLSDFIKSNNAIPEERALEFFKQIVEGYRCIQEHQIVHRDLKPSNILLTSDFIPKISDFGYCEIQGFLPKPKMFYNVGSPSYMAPEAMSKNLYSEKSDLWSLGAILYEMVNGQTFDKGKEVMEAVMAIGKRGVSHVKLLSASTQQIVKQCLTLDPARRINLSKLRDLLSLEKSNPGNTSFYRDDSVVYQNQHASFASGQSVQMTKNHLNQLNQQKMLDSPTKQLTTNRSKAVFRSMVVPPSSIASHTQVKQASGLQQIPKPISNQNVARSFVYQQPIRHTQQAPLAPVMNVLPQKSNIHQILQNPCMKPVVHQQHQQQQQQQQPQHQQQISQASQMQKPRNNIIHVSRRSQIEQPQQRFVSMSPRKPQNTLNPPNNFARRKTVHLNTSIDEISPLFIIPQANRATYIHK